jgi:hypothetical protein
VGELPERADDERRRVPLLERFGVPLVELVEEVGVRRRPPWYCVGGNWGFIVVVGDALGKTPELVVRVREWPRGASVYICCCGVGRTATPGVAMGLRRIGIAPKAGEGEGCAMTECMFVSGVRPSLDGDGR